MKLRLKLLINLLTKLLIELLIKGDAEQECVAWLTACLDAVLAISTTTSPPPPAHTLPVPPNGCENTENTENQKKT